VLFSTLPQSTHPLVTLRPIEPADIAGWFSYLRLPVVVEHTSWNVLAPSELAHYAWSQATCEPNALTRYAIALRATNELVGTAGFHTVSSANRSAELAFDLAPPHWGKGLATYACGLLTDWAHREASMLRVQATVLQRNVRSRRVLERCGYRLEGLLHSYRLVRGIPGDFWMYAHVVVETV
jgi:ribosomal-protein-alanine N-acetyltransferase